MIDWHDKNAIGLITSFQSEPILQYFINPISPLLKHNIANTKALSSIITYWPETITAKNNEAYVKQIIGMDET